MVQRRSFWDWLSSLFGGMRERSREQSLGAQESRVLAEFCRYYGLPFRDLSLLKLALTHRSYLSVTGQGPRESNERLEFLGDSVLGLVTSEFLYRRHPDEHEGQLTKTKSLLVSKAILSRRALRMGLGRFVLMSHSEVESGGRQRLSILADAFESVIGAVYLDQGFEPARAFITQHLLAESDAITSDKRHTNYKSHLQEYVQNAFRTHPVYRIRSEYGPDHSKHFMVEVMVGKRTLGEGRGHNKKEAEQAAARDALEKVEKVRRSVREDDDLENEDQPEREPPRASARASRRDRGQRQEGAAPGRERLPAPVPLAEPVPPIRDNDEDDDEDEEESSTRRRRRSRRGGRARRAGSREAGAQRSPADRTPPVSDDDNEDFVEGVRTDVRDLPDDDDAAGESPRFEAPPGPSSRVAPPAPDGPVDHPAALRAAIADRPEPTGARVLSFGRGRRRLQAAAGPEAEARPVEGEAEESIRVDPYGQDESPDDAKPPVVDVAAAEPEAEPESEAERDARIEEMERALDNFGRRRSPDYGRRGRRR